MTISISSDAEADLKAKAAAAGVDVSQYVSALVEQSTHTSLSLKDLSGPIADDFARTGMTDDEFGDLLEEAKHEMRAEKRARNSS